MHDLVGAYALDALEPQEVDAFELHLAECPKCRAELREHRETAALLAHAGAPAPAGVWDRIAAELGDAAPIGAGTVFPIGRARRPGLRRFAIAAAAVAAGVIAINSAVLLQQRDDIAKLKPSAAASLRALADRAMDDPTSRIATLRRSDGAVAAEAVVTKDGRGYLLHTALPDLDAARAYQLWGLTQYGSPVSLGVLGADGDVRVASFIAKLPVNELAITVEKAAGASAPTGVPLLRGALQRA
jgi:anti-sigma-K factor RskA